VKTNELIESLSQAPEPVPRHAVFLRLAEGVGAGAIVSFVAMWAWLGIRPDISGAMMTSPYWMKFGFTLLLAILAFWATERLARPSLRAGPAFIGTMAVFGILLILASRQMMMAPAAARMHLVMGSSAMVCPWRIALLSLPVFAGTFWSLRALAPTRLILSGAVAGFASGALGAWIYAFHCDESAAPFVLVFYTLGIAVVGAVGAALSRRVLRW
jgi:hypothetical protein